MRYTVICILSLLIILFNVTAYGQETGKEADIETDTIRYPVNLYDTLTFSEDTSFFIRGGYYMFGPAWVTMWGIIEWGWYSTKEFTIYPQSPRGPYAADGAADKFGHLFGTYWIKRFSTFVFRSTGSSRMRANIEGALYAEFVQTAVELGDGVSTMFGFDPYDILFNNIGILAGFLLDWSPTLDRMFALQWEYVPTRAFREKFKIFTEEMDFPTDYSGQKYLFTVKFAGIPHVSLTPFRYFNFNVGYYSRGYKPVRYFNEKSRHLYIGFSADFSIAFGDLLPVGYTSSILQSFFNYYHVPLDYEAKKWTISKVPVN